MLRLGIVLQNVRDSWSSRPDCFDEELFVNSIMDILPLKREYCRMLVSKVATGELSVDDVLDKLIEEGILDES